MLSKSQKRVVLGAAIFVAIVLFVVPAININRYRSSVAESLSRAVGRDVTVQSISIQTFPQPGLLLGGVTVADDPSISAEPMLHADEVLASIRVSSLWRGRLEVGTLKLSYPSLNLARSNDGRWNIASLLERARETPSAPTAKPRPETRIRFPYIEADGARINLKIGNEKKVFALNDTEFAVWMASEDEWRMRMEARPVRTDANLSDTGTLKVEGAWRRAPALHQTPISIRLWWDYGQLGQVTHLLDGRDRGWRGALHAGATINGEPEHLLIHLDARVDDFRRYDIFSADSLSLEVHCNSEYNFTTKELGNIGCQMPAGGGGVLAHGTYQFTEKPRIEMTATAENVPLQYLANLARHAKRDLPSDMNITGMLSAAVAVQGDSAHRNWAGSGEVSAAEIQSSVLSKPLSLVPTQWILAGPIPTKPIKRRSSRNAKNAAPDLPEPTSVAWRLQPMALKLGKDSTAKLAGWFSHDGYYTDLRGEADISRLVELAKLAGIATPASAVTGAAKGALQIFGEWAGFVPPTITADAQLHDVSVKIGGVAAPLHMASGHFVAAPEAFTLDKAEGGFAGLHSTLQLSGTFPQHCAAPQQPACVPDFVIIADQLTLDEVNSLLNPRAQKHPWYENLANSFGGPQAPAFPEIYANLRISTPKLLLKTLPISHFTATVSLKPKTFSMTTLAGETLGGNFTGTLAGDWSGGTPAYRGSAVLKRASMAEVAQQLNDKWASGFASFSISSEASGWNANDLIASVSGTGTFSWDNGTLPHVIFSGHPLQFKNFKGKLSLYNGTFRIDDGELANAAGIYVVSGTASSRRRLDVKLTRNGTPGYAISGTLEHPVVAPLRDATTQAKLTQQNGR